MLLTARRMELGGLRVYDVGFILWVREASLWVFFV